MGTLFFDLASFTKHNYFYIHSYLCISIVSFVAYYYSTMLICYYLFMYLPTSNRHSAYFQH